jgi:hypothetical protein
MGVVLSKNGFSYFFFTISSFGTEKGHGFLPRPSLYKVDNQCRRFSA